MSSGKYACDLRLDRRLRDALVACGVLAWLTGGLLASTMPAPVLLRSALVLLWTVSSFLELRGQWRSRSRIDRIRITSDGRIDGIASNGDRQSLQPLSGSLVSRRNAWLRLRFPDGSCAGEWLRPGSAGNEQWRMLQVIWRQRGGSFGRPLRS